jgi:hypothetical protein
MATVTGNDDIQIEHENDDVGNDLIDNANDDANDDGNDQDTTGTARVTVRAARSTAGGAGQASFNLRVEQNKIPEFFGSKSKDTILAADVIRRLEDLAKTNRWSDLLPFRQLTQESGSRMAFISG